MPIYENKELLRSLHLHYLGQADLPGSDAPKNPPAPTSGTSYAGTHTDERGHSQTRSRGTPENSPAADVRMQHTPGESYLTPLANGS